MDENQLNDSTGPLKPPPRPFSFNDDGEGKCGDDCQEGNMDTMVHMDLEALDSLQNSDHGDPSPRDVVRSRACMTVLHFVLMYPRWSFSLFLLLASWTTPLPTAQEQVTQPIRDLQAVVHNEAKLYHECVDRSFRFQDKHMARVAAAEMERVSAILDANPLEEMAHWTDQCTNATIEIQHSLKEWLSMGFELPNRTEEDSIVIACSSLDRERLDEFLGSDLSKLKNSVQSILSAYIAQSLEALRRILKYSHDRGEYDYNYFIGVKLEAIILILDGFAINPILLSLPEQRIVLNLRNILQDLLNALQGAYFRIDLLAVRIAEFEVSIQAFYINYMDLYGRFALIRVFVRDFVPSGFALPGYFDISGVPLPSALLPPIFEIPQFDGVLPDINDLISEYIIKALKLIYSILEDAAIEATEQTRRMIQALLELLRGLTVLEDYDPPKYPQSMGVEDSDDEVARLHSLAEKSQVENQEALENAKLLYSTAAEPAQPKIYDVDTPVVRESYQNRFTFLALSYPDITLPRWLRAILGFFTSLSFLIECIVQAARFYKLKRKYERHCVPDLPDIDYVQETEVPADGEGQGGDNGASKLQMAQAMLLKNAMNPMVMIGLFLLPFVLLILIFWFPHVKSTCIESRRGTFLARRVIKPLQVNKASLQGYTLQTVFQMQCHRKQQSICSQRSTETSAGSRSQAASLVALQTRFNESTEILGIISRCVDTQKLDEVFQSNCCGLEGYTQDATVCPLDQQRESCPIDKTSLPPGAFRPVGETLLSPACRPNREMFSFDGALFNCSVLEESCSKETCSGVDVDLIGEMSIEADCSAEIYIIQLCFFLASAIFHAIMINLWNIFLYNGVMILRWRKLKPDGIKLTTHVTAGGEFVKGGDIEERRERIEQALRRFELAGWMQLALSAVTFLVWMITVVLLKNIISRFVMYHE